jgi:TonB family protein
MNAVILLLAILLAYSTLPSDPVHVNVQIPRVAILEIGPSPTSKSIVENIASRIKGDDVVVLDRDQSQAAAKGIGYEGSFNLTLKEARELGAVLGCEFFILVESQTLRRSRSEGPAYFESYASIFVVSARTGKLIQWTRPSFEAPQPKQAEKLLLSDLSGVEFRHNLNVSLRRALEDERQLREIVPPEATPIIEALENVESAETTGLQLPRPFRRLRPEYPDSAARADAEATVDVLADIDASGKVIGVEIARWAGFGLDQVTIDTVRRLEFFPALQNGKPIPIRVLLRYNFLKPARTTAAN